MTEQKTIQQVTDLAQTYGPWAALSFIIILLMSIGGFIWFVRNVVHNKATKPIEESRDRIEYLTREVERIRNEKTKLYETITHLKIDMQKRITYEWAEGQLIPKIDKLSDNISALTATINTHDHRISKVERA